ncbi:two-component system response regulator [Clostridium thermobutyricum]|uniref:Stage 0 sporulation protein A homolog n=1 Tax=Clostridium thermobutyricum TaxID=29372 RepID=N9WBT1_9CLOT|nr:response regulator transcription factor [Clostridium thermobutyricum]ENZ00471.1 two-component system response regulator [Clostridium thermobutyricum]
MGLKILILEDDKYLNEIIKSYILSKGYIVTNVFDAEEAKSAIYKQIFDLYILDIMVPKGNGIDILNNIRDMTDNPVLIITALDSENTEIKAFEKGTDDYIRKPFSPNKLLIRIEAILRRANKLTNDEILFKDYKINLKNYNVNYKGEDLCVLKKEFDILKILIENKGIILSREKILDKVWGYDYFGNDRVVDAQIKNLRKKLKTDIIKTVKGIGYIIED